ncbi:MAG: tRNA lysidine(34) synthetase TilS [Chitinivibrionales bacterium]|nr:tRNA lysidine(34) synthetase TilS [Chitinivibrionales bacterium]MBD3395520.1 tRNA lysidine(34) synthetase TilS [Chitinivibrionales bacterium]
MALRSSTVRCEQTPPRVRWRPGSPLLHFSNTSSRPFVLMCENAVQSFCEPLITPGSRVLVAVSGGSDSTALLHIMVRLREKLKISALGVAHVNHGLRGAESDREEEFAARLAGDNGCAFFVKRLSGLTLDDAGLEERARAERYRFFRQIQEKHAYAFVATGHTADDQAETVLMRLLRGSGLNGLAGIWPVRGDGIVRPVLALRRAQLVAWLKAKTLPYCEDSSNADLRFTRNWIRYAIMPSLIKREPRAVEHFCACAETARRYVGELGPRVNKWIETHVLSDEPGGFTVRKWSPDSEEGLISEAAATLFRRHGIPFDRKHVDLFLAESHRTGGRFLLPGGWSFYPRRKHVDIVYGEKPVTAPADFEYTLDVPGTTECREGRCRFAASVKKREGISLMYDRANVTAYLDADVSGKKLKYRRAREGDTFLPLGSTRPRDLMRFLKSQRVENRRAIGVVESEKGEIVWIPHVAVSQQCRVTDNTDTIVTISCQSMRKD